MQTSPAGLRLIRSFESCERKVPGRPGFFRAYRCPSGVLTIGWGHTAGAGGRSFDAATVWSAAECDAVLREDVARFEARVGRILDGVALRQNEFDALVSFEFNTGGLDRSSVPAALRAGRRAGVRAILLRWNKSRGRVLPGLVRRRRAEADLFDGGSPPVARSTAAAAAAAGLAAAGGGAAVAGGGDLAGSAVLLGLGAALFVLAAVLLLRRMLLKRQGSGA